MAIDQTEPRSPASKSADQRRRSRPAAEERTISPRLDREVGQPATEPTPASRAAEPTPDLAAKRAASREVGGETQPTPEVDDRSRSAVSVKKGDVPEALRNRYLVVADKLSGDVSFHTDAVGPNPAFRDTGAKLVTHETNNAVVKDMVATAVHRGWSEVKVTGDPDFRRQVWIEASMKGLEVGGYKPTDRDRQELEKLRDARDARTIEPVLDRLRSAAHQTGRTGPEASPAAPSKAQDGPQRPDYDKGVSGVLIETGRAPYNNEKGKEATAYVTLETSPGVQKQIWGVGLPDALARGGVGIGDQVTVRREGAETVQKTMDTKDQATGATRSEVRDVSRNRWEVTADRFRNATPAQAARDPQLRDAQAMLKVIEVALDNRVTDKDLRAKMLETAKEDIASRLATGATPKEPRVRETATKNLSPAARQAGRGATQTEDRKRPAEAGPARGTQGKSTKAADHKPDQALIQKKPERSRSR